MKRHQRDEYQGADYPDVVHGPDRRQVLQRLGLATGALLLSASSFRCFRVQGLEPAFDDDDAGLSDPFFVTIPAIGYRTVYFDPVGHVGYHLDLQVGSYELQQYVLDDEALLLDAADLVLAQHAVTEFTALDEPARTVLQEDLSVALTHAHQLDTGEQGTITVDALLLDEVDEGEEEWMGEEPAKA